MASAFDDALIESVASIISTEARAFSNVGRAGLDYWTPNINPFKDPRWGRGSETPGEDVFHIKNYVKALLRGLEGDQKFKKIIATCKHYAANDFETFENYTRHNFNAVLRMQDLVEYYLPPFQQCARDSKVGSIMCSYNAVNGTPACANTYLMQTVLREHWGWTEDNQYITSDCGAIKDFYDDHNFTKTAAEAAGIAIPAGTDTVCESNNETDVVGAYRQSLLSEENLDTALRRLFQGLVRTGFFDPAEATEYRSYSWKDVNTPEAQALALQSAVDGFVLKKNEGVLPLELNKKPSVALIGFWAKYYMGQLGLYFGPPPYKHDPLYAAEQLGLETFYATGPDNQNFSVPDNWTENALAAAQKADVVLYFGGNSLSIEAEENDRETITWPATQLQLLEKLASLGKPTIVVELGSQNDDTPLLNNKNISAVLWTGFPGQEGGPAVFDVLTGKSAPAGRLSTTMYPGDYVNKVPSTDMNLRPSSTNPGRTYKWYDGAVLPFGFGLHYTTFEPSFSPSALPNASYAIADLLSGCKEKNADLCHFGSVPIVVKNIGNTTSDFVALAFLSGKYGPEPYPIKELAAYTRLRSIKAGEEKTQELNLTLGNLARVDENGHTVLYPGSYQVLLDVPTQDTIMFELSGQPVVLDKFPQPTSQ
jgi:xylan 1,4-beta-xylosidase